MAGLRFFSVYQGFGGNEEHKGEYANAVMQFTDAINLLIQSGRTIDAIRLDGWRIDVGYPEDRDRAEERLGELASNEEPEDKEGADEAIVDN